MLRILHRISPTRPAPPEPEASPSALPPSTAATSPRTATPEATAPAPGWNDLRTKLQDRLTSASQTLPGTNPAPGAAPFAPKSAPR